MKKAKQFMKKGVIVMLAAAVLLCVRPQQSMAAEPTFTYKDAEDAKLKALDTLMTCAFSSEWDSAGNSSTAIRLMRWEKTIKICVTGSPEKDDLEQLDLFIMEIATHCPNMPNIRIVDNEKDANITIYYGPLDQLSKHVKYYHEGNWGAFSYSRTNYEVVSGQVGIATDVNTTASKRHLLREELVGLFGLPNDHEDYSDSILYQKWTTVGQLSEVDWLMLNMVYDPDLKCGMEAKEAREILLKKIKA